MTEGNGVTMTALITIPMSIGTMPPMTLTRALASLEAYWINVLHLPGVPNAEARDLSNYTVVDIYLKLKQVEEKRL